MKKITVKLEVVLLIHMDEDANLQDVIDELDYDFTDQTTQADVQDMEIKEFEVIDSR